VLGKQVELRFEPQPCVHLPLPPCWEGLLPLSSTFYTGLHPETAGGAPDTLVDKEASVSSVSSPLLSSPRDGLRTGKGEKGGEPPTSTCRVSSNMGCLERRRPLIFTMTNAGRSKQLPTYAMECSECGITRDRSIGPEFWHSLLA
jgi:hypothetical protein